MITAVVPYYGYARQDKKVLAREPISAKLIADLLSAAGSDRVVSVDLHAGQIQGYFDFPFDHLTALPVLTGYLQNELGLHGDDLVRSTSAGSRPPSACASTCTRISISIRGAHGPRPTRSTRWPSWVVGGPALHPGRRHDRHREHRGQGRDRARPGVGRARSTPPPHTPCSRARRQNLEESPISRSSSRTRCRSPRRRARQAPGARSRR